MLNEELLSHEEYIEKVQQLHKRTDHYTLVQRSPEINTRSTKTNAQNMHTRKQGTN